MKSTKMKTKVCLVVLCVFLIGCSTESQQATSNQGSSHSESDSHSHPNLSLHKPETLSSATQRLKQIHVSLLASGEFPAPISIQYVEVVHGTGASGHSHFYSADEYEANEGGDKHAGFPGEHNEEDETVKRHSAEVDLRTELTDIVAWLPDIAAKSNLDEADWNSVKSISGRLTKVINEIAADASDNSFRESWKLASKEIEPMLDELQTNVDSASGAEK